MYYFPNHISGTGFATMELLNSDGNGPLPNMSGTYELVAFTKHPYENIEAETPFNLIERRFCMIFTAIANYSLQAVINTDETCKIPDDSNQNIYIIFYSYQPEGKEFKIGEKKHHLLLCLEVFENELDYAKINGNDALIQKLKQAGHYPYSDLDRNAVI